MRYWKENFTLKKEYFTRVPVWIQLYSLPTDYWAPSILKAIGNELGEYIKMSKGTKNGHYISYARICAYIDVSGALPEAIKLNFKDEIWTQTVDYEHIPFRCRKCHEHVISQRLPTKSTPPPKDNQASRKDEQGFIKVGNRSRQGKRNNTGRETPKIAQQNKYDILSTIPEETGQHSKSKEQTTEQEKALNTMGTEMDNTTIFSQEGQMAQDDTNMDFIQDIPMSEEKAIEDILMGMDLQKIAKDWNKGIEGIPEDHIQRIEEAYILQQSLQQQREHQTKGKNLAGGIKANLKANHQITKGPAQKRGQKTNSQHLQELDIRLINEGKVRVLSLSPNTLL